MITLEESYLIAVFNYVGRLPAALWSSAAQSTWQVVWATARRCSWLPTYRLADIARRELLC